jgi:hypothetical protein
MSLLHDIFARVGGAVAAESREADTEPPQGSWRSHDGRPLPLPAPEPGASPPPQARTRAPSPTLAEGTPPPPEPPRTAALRGPALDDPAPCDLDELDDHDQEWEWKLALARAKAHLDR